MKELKKRLKALEENGYETVTIGQILQWMAEIERENMLKDFKRKGGMV
ncbi:MAG: hypothetical protein IPJ00_22625 [Saprospirales bacterium]|nr:hypothetical protein [Saprospirales bacterium]